MSNVITQQLDKMFHRNTDMQIAAIKQKTAEELTKTAQILKKAGELQAQVLESLTLSNSSYH